MVKRVNYWDDLASRLMNSGLQRLLFSFATCTVAVAHLWISLLGFLFLLYVYLKSTFLTWSQSRLQIVSHYNQQMRHLITNALGLGMGTNPNHVVSWFMISHELVFGLPPPPTHTFQTTSGFEICAAFWEKHL